MAKNNRRAAVFAQKAADGFQVLFFVFADQSQHRLRGEAEFIGDRDADAAAAEIEAQQAGLHSPDGIASTER